MIALNAENNGKGYNTENNDTQRDEHIFGLFQLRGVLDGDLAAGIGVHDGGEALLAEGLIAGSESEYGLYINTVNGIIADWDKDQTYWAFYVNGEYATTGVDSTEITEGATYGLTLTKG